MNLDDLFCGPDNPSPYRRRRKAKPGSRLAALRSECHAAFDVHWQLGGVSRSAAYRWLAKELDMLIENCHFGMMDEAECEAALRLLRAYGPSDRPDPGYEALLSIPEWPQN